MNKLLESLETKVAFQDATIEQLNQIVTNLQYEVCKLREQLVFISHKLQATEQTNIVSLNEETPPPHY